jgi:N4-gp56 family major capsid protein
MANAYTDSSALAGLVKTAYDRYVEFALRSQPLIRSVADKRPAQQAMPGSSVVFSIYNDLAPVTAALSSESTDPDAVALSDVTTVAVTLAEYGNASLVTRKLQLFSLSDVDPAVADIIAYNMADSLDKLAMETLRAGTNVIYGGSRTSTATITASDTLTAAKIRKAVAKLRSNKAVPREGSLYWCGIHPEVSHDLRAETGVGGWNDMHKYAETGTGNFWAGSIGTFEGAFFVETPRMYTATDGASSATVYRTILAGKQALAEAVAQEPSVVIGPVTDKLLRFRPIGWYGVLGFSLYRQAALYRIETGSSIAS